MRSNALDGVVAAAVNGVGLVRAPAWQVSEYVAAGQLKVILRDNEAPPLPIQAVLTHNKLLSSKVRVLLDFLIVNAAAKMHRLAGAKIHQRCWQEGPRTGALSSDIRLGRVYPPVCPSWHGVSGSCSD